MLNTINGVVVLSPIHRQYQTFVLGVNISNQLGGGGPSVSSVRAFLGILTWFGYQEIHPN